MSGRKISKKRRRTRPANRTSRAVGMPLATDPHSLPLQLSQRSLTRWNQLAAAYATRPGEETFHSLLLAAQSIENDSVPRFSEAVYRTAIKKGHSIPFVRHLAIV